MIQVVAQNCQFVHATGLGTPYSIIRSSPRVPPATLPSRMGRVKNRAAATRPTAWLWCLRDRKIRRPENEYRRVRPLWPIFRSPNLPVAQCSCRDLQDRSRDTLLNYPLLAAVASGHSTLADGTCQESSGCTPRRRLLAGREVNTVSGDSSTSTEVHQEDKPRHSSLYHCPVHRAPPHDRSSLTCRDRVWVTKPTAHPFILVAPVRFIRVPLQPLC